VVLSHSLERKVMEMGMGMGGGRKKRVMGMWSSIGSKIPDKRSSRKGFIRSIQESYELKKEYLWQSGMQKKVSHSALFRIQNQFKSIQKSRSIDTANCNQPTKLSGCRLYRFSTLKKVSLTFKIPTPILNTISKAVK
jgi:hypothetical protein